MSITLDWQKSLSTEGFGYGAFIRVTDGIAENSHIEPRGPSRPLTQFHCIFLTPIRLHCCGGPFFSSNLWIHFAGAPSDLAQHNPKSDCSLLKEHFNFYYSLSPHAQSVGSSEHAYVHFL